MRIVGFALAGAAALVLSACGGGDTADVVRDQGAQASSLAAESAPETVVSGSLEGITVVGTGSAKAVPDVAEWSFGVRSDGGSARGALAENGAAMKRVLRALRAAGVKKADLRTEQVSLYPRTDETGRTVVGYDASNTVHATVRSIRRTGVIVDAAVRAGANEVYGPNLVVSESDDQYAQAVNAAYDDARARAEAVAAKAGVSLGRPIAIVEGAGGDGMYEYGGYAANADLAVPIEPGTQQIQATLTVTFAIS